jgi:nucleotide-binding universal stress UspA family protein
MRTTEKMKVLWPVDFGVNSIAALDLACDLVRDKDGSLCVVHAVTALDPSRAECEHQSSRIRLNELSWESLRDVDYRLILRTGRAAKQIVATAAELAVGLLVVGTHGRSGVSQFFLDSMAERVIRKSPCPVLTIRGPSAYKSGIVPRKSTAS